MTSKQIKIDRLSLWMIFLIVLFVTFGGVLQFKSYITAYQRTLLHTYVTYAEKVQQQAQGASGPLSPTDKSLDALQQEDTDADTLSDFDELYIYNTSPYLADTDSDGTDDRAEIAAGTSPTCAAGLAECATTPAQDASTVTAGNIAEFEIPEGFVPSDDPVELRKQLTDLGIPKNLLDQLNDITLRELVAGSSGEVNEEDLVASAIATLEQMSPEQKRAFLVESGASADQVATLRDDDVQKLFEDALQDVIAAQGASAEASNTILEGTEESSQDGE